MYSTQIHVHSHSQEGLERLPERLTAVLSSEDLHLHLNDAQRSESGEYVADFGGTTPAITRVAALLLLAQFPDYAELSAVYNDAGVERVIYAEAREGLRMVQGEQEQEQEQEQERDYFPVAHTEEERIACEILDELPEREELPEKLSFLRSDFWTWDALRPLSAEEQQLLFALPPEAVVFTAQMNTELPVTGAEFTPQLLGVERPEAGVRVNLHYNSRNIYLVFREYESAE
ncbi:hypothetical protein [Curtobacterium sp. MCBA15_001]|uniref:hypothetical protein n=1 Tax=Curtobacterium sp. MCBA15_001 TaxID=1898731 RepID=UPI0008DE60D6|nr:hypothetical protein [Curtobacterium sp. MCBA15_001]OIH97914.1 hypothetical protein BIU90_12905 [Curtobacterium sp. MCBA15_001]